VPKATTRFAGSASPLLRKTVEPVLCEDKGDEIFALNWHIIPESANTVFQNSFLLQTKLQFFDPSGSRYFFTNRQERQVRQEKKQITSKFIGIL